MIEIKTIGGYSEVGKNCTAIKVDDEVILFDLGLQLDKYINYTENEDIQKCDMNPKKIAKLGIVPNLDELGDWKKKVIAMVSTHAHLDHIGAIPLISDKLNADIYCTPYAAEVLKTILKDDKLTIKNEIKTLTPNSKVQLSDNIELEFVHITHSTPQTVMAVIHTPYGSVVYANDFKLDNHPVLGKKPNVKRLKQLGEKGVACLIMDALYSKDAMKTPSENVAKEMLRDVMLGIECEGKAVIVTTFSSHLARLKSIIEFGKKMDRKILFMGRSLSKYVIAGENIGLVDFSKQVELVRFRKQIMNKLKKIEKEKEKYLIVCTGHQGEQNAVLSRIADDTIPFKLEQGDNVIFSCVTIPAPVNIANREELEERLRSKGVRLFKDIHVSGHAAREDHRDVIDMLKPEHIIPSHGDLEKTTPLVTLAAELGYKPGETVHLMQDGQVLRIE